MVLVTSVTSFASDEDVVIIKRDSREIFADSSEANRINKKIDLHVTLLGVSSNFANASGLTLGYWLDRNSQVLAEVRGGKGGYTRHRYESYNSVSREFSTDTTINQVGVHYKRFTGNSFYFRTGVDYSQVDYKYDLRSSLYDDNMFMSRFKGTSFVGSFVIGNQWQWDNFTLGCDWIGYAVPVMYSISDEVKPTLTDSSYEIREYENDQKRYVSDNSAVLLRFYLGASF
jgi:hypothetical protein